MSFIGINVFYQHSDVASPWFETTTIIALKTNILINCVSNAAKRNRDRVTPRIMNTHRFIDAMLRDDGGFTAQIELLWVSSGEVRDGANLVFRAGCALALRVQLRNATMCQKTTIGRSEFRRTDKSTFLGLVKQMYCFG